MKHVLLYKKYGLTGIRTRNIAVQSTPLAPMRPSAHTNLFYAAK